MLDENVIKVIKQIAENEEFSVNPCFFLYNSSDIRDKIDRLSQRPENVSLYYAMKANPFKEILKHMRTKKTVKGIQIASVGELKKARKFFNAKDIIFTGPGKTPFELAESIDEGIRLINIESLTEAYRINDIATKGNYPPIDILLSINTVHNFFIEYLTCNFQCVKGISGPIRSVDLQNWYLL